MWEWVKWISAQINKDVVNPNKSKKNAVMTRCICAVMGIYAIGQVVFMLQQRYLKYLMFPLGIFCLYFIALYLTYSNQTTIAYYMVIMMVVTWCFISTDLYGWNTGAQYAYCTVLVYIFNSADRTIKRKMLDACLLLGMGMITFILAMTGTPVFYITKHQVIVQEILNMVSTFLSLGLITVSFSKDTLDAEQKLMDYNREMTHQAETDALTGLMNRRAGEKYFKRICDRSVKEGFFVNVVMGDIDYFKAVNDTYGHDAGDEVLRAISAIFKEYIIPKGAAIRWGGEEFLFVLIGMNGDEAEIEIEKLRRSIQELKIQTEQDVIQVTMTFGVEEVGRDQSLEESLEAADRKLYMGKAKGRNQVVM